MGYTCVPQVLGLVRGEPKEGAKHRANGEKICEEAGNERYSQSRTLDRTRSHLNEYDGFRSGGKCWEAMAEDAEAYQAPVKMKNGRTAMRKLRADAVIGWAVIFNPPADMCAGWTKDDYERFDTDSFEVLNEIEPRLFRRENIRMSAKHRDEGTPDEQDHYGEHEHRIGDAKDQDGRYCGNLIDAGLMDRINKDYPAKMRARGWNLDDVDRTDFSRMGKNPDGTYKDPEYRAARKAKQREKKAGRSVNQYLEDLAKKEARNLEKSDEILQEVEKIRDQAAADAVEQLDQMRADQILDRWEMAEQSVDLALRERTLRKKEMEVMQMQEQTEKELEEARLQEEKAEAERAKIEVLRSSLALAQGIFAEEAAEDLDQIRADQILNQWEAAEQSADMFVQQREADSDRKRANDLLKYAHDEVDRSKKGYAAREKVLNDRESGLDAREKDLDERERNLGRRESGLEAKEEAATLKWQKVSEKEAALDRSLDQWMEYLQVNGVPQGAEWGEKVHALGEKMAETQKAQNEAYRAAEEYYTLNNRLSESQEKLDRMITNLSSPEGQAAEMQAFMERAKRKDGTTMFDDFKVYELKQLQNAQNVQKEVQAAGQSLDRGRRMGFRKGTDYAGKPVETDEQRMQREARERQQRDLWHKHLRRDANAATNLVARSDAEEQARIHKAMTEDIGMQK